MPIEQEIINMNILKNKIECYQANGESEFCKHNNCTFNFEPCIKLEKILRSN